MAEHEHDEAAAGPEPQQSAEPRVCQAEGCTRSLEGKQASARFCSNRCGNAHWRAENSSHILAYKEAYREANRDTINERISDYRIALPHLNRMKRSRYRARQLQADLSSRELHGPLAFVFPPGWDRAIFTEARRLTEETRIEHHADHLVPLTGCRDCGQAGLHALGNLVPRPAPPSDT